YTIVFSICTLGEWESQRRRTPGDVPTRSALGTTVMATDARSVVEEKARELLRTLAELSVRVGPLREAEVEGGLACLIQVWPAGEVMPVASAERRRRAKGTREQCRKDVLGAVQQAGRPLTRKEVVRALREARKPHGVGTVAKALADLTAAGELVNPRDKKGYRLPDWPRRKKTPSLF